MVIERYLPSYRQNEIALACSLAQRGESLCFLGVAGTGKSNIVRILRYQREIKAQYLGTTVDRVLFAVADATTWDGTPTGLYKLLHASLSDVTRDLAVTAQPSKVVILDEEERARRALFDLVETTCQTHGYQLVFVCDDFDRVLVTGPLPMLEQLNALRSAENREKLSYLLFTKRLPHLLGRGFGMGSASKFYDLIKLNIFALGMYEPSDAKQMLKHLNAMAGAPLNRQDLGQIEWLTGGHARLLKIVFDSWLQEAPNDSDPIGFFGSHSAIGAECRRILAGLHDQERRVAVRFARRTDFPTDAPTVAHLHRRGLITDIDRRNWFSPLMASYLLTAAEE